MTTGRRPDSDPMYFVACTKCSHNGCYHIHTGCTYPSVPGSPECGCSAFSTESATPPKEVRDMTTDQPKEGRDPGGNEVPQVVQDQGRLRLRNRTKRLARLVELNAPTLIIANEAFMIIDALLIIDPETTGTSWAQREHAELRGKMGFCKYAHCGNELKTDAEKTLGFCASCYEDEEGGDMEQDAEEVEKLIAEDLKNAELKP